MTGERPRDAAPVCHDETPVCHDGTCITCSDVAVQVRVTRLLPGELAIVDTGQGEEQVSVALVAAAAGDTILVHAGEAIALVGK
jgi:hydrogenase expression/formation protein HypC